MLINRLQFELSISLAVRDAVMASEGKMSLAEAVKDVNDAALRGVVASYMLAVKRVDIDPGAIRKLCHDALDRAIDARAKDVGLAILLSDADRA